MKITIEEIIQEHYFIKGDLIDIAYIERYIMGIGAEISKTLISAVDLQTIAKLIFESCPSVCYMEVQNN